MGVERKGRGNDCGVRTFYDGTSRPQRENYKRGLDCQNRASPFPNIGLPFTPFMLPLVA